MAASRDDGSAPTTRVFCMNDACEVKDMRVEGAGAPRCPECGTQMTYNSARPQRQYRSY